MGPEQPGVVGDIRVHGRDVELDELYGPSQPKPFRADGCGTSVSV